MTLTEDLPFAALRHTWQPVANAPALPRGAVIGYTLLETELVIARFPNGTLLAANVACPHKGARLSAGCFRAGALMCPYHGWRFSSDGACLDIPSLVEPNAEKQALAHLHTYAVQERYGMIWVKLESDPAAATTPVSPASSHALPDVPE